MRESGISHVFLRPADFMQNLADIHSHAIQTRNEIAVPAGHGRSAFLDVEDVGRATASILANPAIHAGKSYDLTGPDRLTFSEIANALSTEQGRRIRYKPVSIPRFLRQQVSDGRSVAISLVMAALYTVQRFDKAAQVSRDFEILIGNPSGDLHHYLQREHRAFAAKTNSLDQPQ